MKEIWKDIQGYEGYYQVSNLGRVKSLKRKVYGIRPYPITKKEKILSQSKTGRDRDYLFVSLSRDKITKHINVHRLVAKAFIPNPNNYPCVNHINEFEKWNNSIENLEWCTYKYNNNYGTCIERRVQHTDYNKKVLNTNYKLAGIKSGIARSKKVYQFTLKLELVKVWGSSQECKINGFSQSCVNACCLNKRKTHKGFIWRYTDDVSI